MKVTWGSMVHTTCVKFFYLKWFIKDCNYAEVNVINTRNLNTDDTDVNNTTDETSKCFTFG